MNQQPFSRRSLLQGTLAGGIAAAPYVYSRRAVPSPEALTPQVSARTDPITCHGRQGNHPGRVEANSEAARTRAPTPPRRLRRRSHGRRLYIAAAIGQPGPRLEHKLRWDRQELEAEGVDPSDASRLVRRTWWEHKPLESAFEMRWQEDWRALYQLTGLDLAIEDNAGHYTFDQCLRWMATSNLAYGRLPDVVRIASAENLRQARSQGKLGLLSQLQGVHALCGARKVGGTPGPLLRTGSCAWPQLSHTHSNAVACGTPTSSGTGTRVSPGRATNWCARMNELGVAVDLSHAARRTALDAAETSVEPVINSHTACSAVYRDIDQRNVDDDYLRVVGGQGRDSSGSTSSTTGSGIMGTRVTVQNGTATRPVRRPSNNSPGTWNTPSRWPGIDHVGIGTDLNLHTQFLSPAHGVEQLALLDSRPGGPAASATRRFGRSWAETPCAFWRGSWTRKPWGAYGPG